jgi:hypothetical protein
VRPRSFRLLLSYCRDYPSMWHRNKEGKQERVDNWVTYVSCSSSFVVHGTPIACVMRSSTFGVPKMTCSESSSLRFLKSLAVPPEAVSTLASRIEFLIVMTLNRLLTSIIAPNSQVPRRTERCLMHQIVEGSRTDTWHFLFAIPVKRPWR